VTLALYVPRASLVHRAPAGLKLLGLAALGVVVFVFPLPAVVGAALAVVLGIGLAVARLPAALLGRQARTVLWWLVVIFALQALLADVVTAAVTVSRLLTLVLAAAVVTATTRVSDMVRLVERVCRPLAWVGVRPARIGLVLAMALRFIPLIAERADRIREAQAARGGTTRGLRGLATLVVPLLVQVLQLATTVSEALDARGADDVPLRSTKEAP
jgi:biotin transport system permease protein